MLIPSGFFNSYYTVMDEVLDNIHIGKTCTIYYPSKKENCPNCSTTNVNGYLSSVYKSGGPIYFDFGICPLCNGVGFKETIQTEDIKLKLYFNYKQWIKVGNFEYEDGKVQCIGHKSDVPKILKAEKIKLISDASEYSEYDYKVSGNVFPHGFGNKYFVVYLKK